MTSKFDEGTVSDQKRVARAESWLLARTLLRSQDRVHHAAWNVATLAGGHPSGEIGCIRELMPKAKITVIDKDESCVLRGIDAGADDALCVDLGDFTVKSNGMKLPNIALQGRKFDVLNLDLCAGASEETRQLLRAYSPMARVLMVTFSYGRDVVEFFKFQPAPSALTAAGVPDLVSRRVSYVLSGLRGNVDDRIRSLILYQGNEMPMCSLVVADAPRHGQGASFIKLNDGDLEDAVLYPDAANLYDLPAERIQAIRRSAAAKKAVATRRATQRALDL